jgi:sugar diacid utilization regulator/putative methionine-R-sulfoxide reductase with GAF domain
MFPARQHINDVPAPDQATLVNALALSFQDTLAKAKPPQAGRVPSPAAIERALRTLQVAAERGYYVLLAEAEKVFTTLTGAQGARVVLHSGGVWRYWDALEGTGRDEASFTTPGSDEFVPVRPGELGIVLESARGGHRVASMLAAALDLALAMCELRRIAAEDGDKMEVMQRVAVRILNSRDLQEILLLITHEAKRLLDADICGIMLREGNAVVMKRCVGNLSSETGSLRMQPGQGLAGRVFELKEPCHVENYLESRTISHDFMHLARLEKVRSALAAPLLSQDVVVGVLEVWRRRTSTFDEVDTQRIVALANLTSLAIQNARLTEEREAIVHELAAANEALVARYEVIHASATFQHDLIRLLLERKNLPQVAAHAAQHLGGEVVILGADLQLEGSSCTGGVVPEGLHGHVQASLRTLTGGELESVRGSMDGKAALLQSVVAGTEWLGLVALLREAPIDESAELGLSQVCLATALHLVERRAAARVRAETLGSVLWDLLEGTEDVRRFASVRARELHVDLEARQRVVLCAVDGIEQHAATSGWSATEFSARRRRIAQVYHQLPAFADSVRLAGMRGNLVALICGGKMLSDAERFGLELATAVAAQAPGASVRVGASAPCSGPGALSAAYREARISLEVARQRGGLAAVRYEDAGIVGMLLSLRDEGDVRKLVQSILGPLLELKPHTRDLLIGTLDAFFAVNCSRHAASIKLCVHEKTIAYRLTKIEGLTGLDLAQHEKRLLADIALRMYRMTSGATVADPAPI